MESMADLSQINVPTVTLNDDREMPLLGLGTYKLRGAEGEKIVRRAIELGYRKFDTASMYANEDIVGKAINDAVAAGDVSRDEIFVTTKLWNDDQGRDNVAPAFHKSLTNLGLDYVDLYLVHWPCPAKGLYAETFDEIARMQGMGQIASIGVANFYEETLRDLASKTGVVPVSNQIELHPGFTQPGLRKVHEELGVVTEAWAPIARGAVLDNTELKQVAGELGATEGQVALAFLMQLGISVIPKTATPSRLEENLGAAGVTLSSAQMDAIAGLEGREGFGRMFNDPRQWPED